jgi:hypothetical protein
MEPPSPSPSPTPTPTPTPTISLIPVERVRSARLRSECKYMGIPVTGMSRMDMIHALKNTGYVTVDVRWPAKPPRIDTSDRSDDLSNVFVGNGAGKYENRANRLHIANSATRTPLIGGDFVERRVEIQNVLNVRESDDVGANTPGEVGDIRRVGSCLYMYRADDRTHPGWYPIEFGPVVVC